MAKRIEAIKSPIFFIYLFIYLFYYLFTYLFIYLFIHLFIYLKVDKHQIRKTVYIKKIARNKVTIHI